MPENFDNSPHINFSTQNSILDALPVEDLERLLPDLEEVYFSLGQVVYHAQEPIGYVYFPDNSMISVIAAAAAGECAEVGVIGWEGIVGVNVLMGAESTLNENIIPLPDGAHRIKTAAIIKEFKRTGAFHDLALQFINLLMMPNQSDCAL